MNTQHVKKQVISKKLGELFAGTCQYSPSDMARYDSMEPNELNGFREVLSALADNHFNNVLSVNDIEDALNFVENIGRNFGHVASSYTMGTWGVRYSELKDFIKILLIPDFEMVKEGTVISWNDNEYILKQVYSLYTIEKSFFTVTLQSVEHPESDSFDACFDYNDIEVFKA